jgi:hypothetical protein
MDDEKTIDLTIGAPAGIGGSRETKMAQPPEKGVRVVGREVPLKSGETAKGGTFGHLKNDEDRSVAIFCKFNSDEDRRRESCQGAFT